MPKSLTVTEDVKAKLHAIVGADVDPNTITVFEASAVNTKPISKRGSLFDKATITRQTLTEMVEAVKLGGGIPMHTRHLQGEEMPVGRVFHAEVFDRFDGSSELRVLFYMSNTETKLIADLENATIDEVSIGLQTAHILCSECGWDYLGEEASFDNIWDRTCANGHVIGENGVHVNLAGVDRWYELSLVSIGAAKDAKIQSRANALLASDFTEHQSRLAASGISPQATCLTAQFKEIPDMDIKEFTAALTASETKAAELTIQLAATTEKLTASTNRITELEASVAELTTLKAENEKLTASAKKADGLSTFIMTEAKAALTAAGLSVVIENTEQAIEAISKAKVHLHNTFPVGGVTQPADVAIKMSQGTSLSAFKSNRK